MIQVNNVTKRFGRTAALSGINSAVPDGCIYGLVGSNGAGKSTLLRLMAGVYSPETGSVELDGQRVYDNPAMKGRLALVPDEAFFLPGSNIARMAALYATAYRDFDRGMLAELCGTFHLRMDKPVNTFSKGMRRQAAFVLAMSCRTRYLLLDETFDGFDPILRNLARRLVYDAVCERGVTAVLTSHSLRELEDTCDQLALLHRGGLVLQSDVDSLKTTLCKVQIVLQPPFTRAHFDELGLDILNYNQHGSVASLILRGDRDELIAKLYTKQPLLCEALPLSLEEVFVYELNLLGYSFDRESVGGDRGAGSVADRADGGENPAVAPADAQSEEVAL